MSFSVTRLAASLGGAALVVIAAGGCDASSPSYDDTSIATPDTGTTDEADSGPGLDAEVDDVSTTDVGDVSHVPDSGEEDADVATDADTGGDEDIDTAPPASPGGFGDYCDEQRPCDEGHFCHIDVGVCTRECDSPGDLCPGLPAPNTYSKCLYELDGGYACAFICVLDHDNHVHVYDCPPELSCEGTGGPGAGHQFCEY